MPKNDVVHITLSRKILLLGLAVTLVLGTCVAVFGLLGVKALKGHLQTLYNLDAKQAAMMASYHQAAGALPQETAASVHSPQEKIKLFQNRLGFEPEEYLALNETEKNTAPLFITKQKPAEFDTQYSEKFLGDRASEKTDKPTQYFFLSNTPIPVEKNLTSPKLSMSKGDSQHPIFKITNLPKNGHAYYEFDTNPNFNSADLWRFPTLSPLNTQEDKTLRSGQVFNIFKTSNALLPGPDGAMKTPFRISAMALPAGGDASFTQMAKYAQLLGYGLDHDETISEIFSVNSQRIEQGSDTYKRNALETFSAGIAECGHLNNLTGVMLEMNGIRYRMASGFNPILRTKVPGGGHAGMEVINAAGNWEYVDPYVGVHASGVMAKDLSNSKYGEMRIFKTPPEMVGTYGLSEWVTLGHLFRYRTYYDPAKRVPMARAIRLEPSEQSYAKMLSLRVLSDDDILRPRTDIPKQVKIYVRARYVVSDTCAPNLVLGCSDREAVASEWTVSDFTISPHDLLDIR